MGYCYHGVLLDVKSSSCNCSVRFAEYPSSSCYAPQLAGGTQVPALTPQMAGGNVHTGAPPPWFEGKTFVFD